MTKMLSRQQRRYLARQSQKQDQQIEQVNELDSHVTIRGGSKTKSYSQLEQVQGWVPKHQEVEIAGKLVRGLVYVGKPPIVQTIFGENQFCNAYIDPSLPVSMTSSQKSYVGTDFYFTYASLSPFERNKYLDWLVAGKTREHFDPRFIQIYFLGLERRLLADNPTSQDINDILMELTLLSDNFRIQNFEFLYRLQRFYLFTTDIAPYYENASKSDFYIDPMLTKVEGSLKASNDELLGYQYFYCYLDECDDEIIESALQNHPHEFKFMFKLEFEKKIPDGIPSYSEEPEMFEEYLSISSEFSCDDFIKFRGNYLESYLDYDFFWSYVYPIARKVAKNLNSNKRKNRKSRDKITLQNPKKSILSGNSNSDLQYQKQVIENWKDRILKQKNEISVYDVLKITGTADPSVEFTKQQWDRAVDKFMNSDFGLVPELSLFMEYANFDDPITIIELDRQDHEWRKTSKKYFSVLISVALGFLIFSKDGSLTKTQKSTIETLIKGTKGLKRAEKIRLSHNFQRMLKSPPFPKFTARLGHYKKLIDPNIVRPFLVKCASIGNLNNAKTVSLMETIYKRMGVDTALVYSDLHAEESTSQYTEIRKKQGKIRELDFEKINKIRSETEQVSEVLGGIFNEQQAVSSSEKSNLVGSLGLDNKHEILVRNLLDKSNWTESEFEKLVKQQGLFTAGALESINEWAFDRFEAPLIDDHDGYQVDVDIIEKITLELEGEKLAA